MSLGLAVAKKGSMEIQRRRLSTLQPCLLARVAEVARFQLQQSQARDCGTVELPEFLLKGVAAQREDMTWKDVTDFLSS